jgi:hypothetical protein
LIEDLILRQKNCRFGYLLFLRHIPSGENDVSCRVLDSVKPPTS